MRTPLVTTSGVVAVAALAVLVSLGTGLWPGEAASEGEVDGPVIATGDGGNAYPLAIVQGGLELVAGCLVLGDEVVFWPDGTSWDEERQAVEFGGDFDGAPAAEVGERFRGGGGHYSLENVRGLGGLDGDAVARCLRETGAGGAVLAYPDV